MQQLEESGANNHNLYATILFYGLFAEPECRFPMINIVLFENYSTFVFERVVGRHDIVTCGRYHGCRFVVAASQQKLGTLQKVCSSTGRGRP